MGKSPVRGGLQSSLIQPRSSVSEFEDENNENLGDNSPQKQSPLKDNANSPTYKRKREAGFETPPSRSQKRPKKQSPLSPCSEFIAGIPDRRTAAEREADKALYARENKRLKAFMNALSNPDPFYVSHYSLPRTPLIDEFIPWFRPIPSIPSISETPSKRRRIEKDRVNIEDDKNSPLIISSGDAVDQNSLISSQNSGEALALSAEYSPIEGLNSPKLQDLKKVASSSDYSDDDSAVSRIYETEFEISSDVSRIYETEFEISSAVSRIYETEFETSSDVSRIYETVFETSDSDIYCVDDISSDEISNISATDEDDSIEFNEDEINIKRRGVSEPLRFVPGDSVFPPQRGYPGEDPTDPIGTFSEDEVCSGDVFPPPGCYLGENPNDPIGTFSEDEVCSGDVFPPPGCYLGENPNDPIGTFSEDEVCSGDVFPPPGCYLGENPNDPIGTFSEDEANVSQSSAHLDLESGDDDPLHSEDDHKIDDPKSSPNYFSDNDKENKSENGRALPNDSNDSGKKIKAERKRAVPKKNEWDITMFSFFTENGGRTVRGTHKTTAQGNILSTYTNMNW